MPKYLKSYTLQERWETFKSQGNNIHLVAPLISAIESLSNVPTVENIDMVRQLERQFEPEMRQLDAEDLAVIEDMVTRILYQAYQQTQEGITRWAFTLERARDKGYALDFNKMNDIITESEGLMKAYANAGYTPNEYVALQRGYLAKLTEQWGYVQEKLAAQLSPFYRDFFERQFASKRDVIKRHVEYFQDNAFGEWLHGLRIEKGWSLVKAADKTGVSSSYIHRIEKGRRGVPSVPKLEQLAEGYDIPYSTMIVMASGDIQPLDVFIEEGAYLIGGKLALGDVKDEYAELVRLIASDEDEDGLIRKIKEIRDKLKHLES